MSTPSLSPIPAGVVIVDPAGAITDFFRLRWEELIARFQTSPTVATVQKLTQTAAIVTVAAFTTRAAGNYRITVALQKTIADGVLSSLTTTISWTSRGIAMTHAFAALTTDALGANDSEPWSFWADANSDISYAIAYASNTPAKMTFHADVTVESVGT